MSEIIRCLVPWLMVVTAASADTVYRCHDEQGGVIFQQLPCSGGLSEPVEITPQVVDWVGSREDGRGGKASLEPRKRQSRKRPKRARSKVASEKECFRNRQKLEQVQWKLRKGYRPAEGEKLKQRRRQLEAFDSRYCR
ncbi:MAG: DUF4124 domain-containing protein [Sedimenticola sp.]